MKNLSIILLVVITFSSNHLIAQSRYQALLNKQKETQDLLNSATVKLNDCLDEAANAKAQMAALMEQNAFLKKQSEGFHTTIHGFTQLASKGPENLEKTLESLSESNVEFNKLRKAIKRRDYESKARNIIVINAEHALELYEQYYLVLNNLSPKEKSKVLNQIKTQFY